LLLLPERLTSTSQLQRIAAKLPRLRRTSLAVVLSNQLPRFSGTRTFRVQCRNQLSSTHTGRTKYAVVVKGNDLTFENGSVGGVLEGERDQRKPSSELLAVAREQPNLASHLHAERAINVEFDGRSPVNVVQLAKNPAQPKSSPSGIMDNDFAKQFRAL